MSKITPRESRYRRHRRVRGKITGTSSRPRLCVFRSLNHIYAQVTDDSKNHTLASASTLEPEIKSQLNGKDKSAQADVVGTTVAKRALSLGIEQVIFDRGGYKYHGRVKAMADAARQAGLKF